MKSLARILLSSIPAAACLFAARPASADPAYLSRPEVRAFIAATSEQHHIDRAYLERILGDARSMPAVTLTMTTRS